MFIALLSLFASFFFTGYVLFSFKKLQSPLFSGAAFCLAFGMIIQFFLLLLVQKFSFALLPCAGVSLGGVFLFLRDLKSRSLRFEKEPYPETYVGFILVFILFAFAMISEPITGWDPTAIWFLSAKMIYSAQSVGLSAGWADASLGASFHTDYPKLFGALSAVLMSFVGQWDEYKPKLGFVFLLTPCLLWLASFYRRKLSFLFLAFAFLVTTQGLLWSGVLDAYLTFYFGLTVLLTERFLRDGKKIDLYSALTTLAILTNLKNEGVVIALALGLAAAFVFRPKLKRAWLGLIVFIPAGFWFLLKYFWKIQNYLEHAVLDPSRSVSARLADGHSVKMIGDALFLKNHPVRDVFLVFIIVKLILYYGFKVREKQLTLVQVWIGLSSGFYFCCLFLVYLATPFDLNWHLFTSIDRTTLPFQLAIYLMLFTNIVWVDCEMPSLWKP